MLEVAPELRWILSDKVWTNTGSHGIYIGMTVL